MFPLNAATNIVPIFKEYKSSTVLAQMIAETIHVMVSVERDLKCAIKLNRILFMYERN